MYRIDIRDQEITQTKQLLADITARFQSVEDPAFLAEAAILAHELPRRLRETLYSFKIMEEGKGVCVVGGLPIDDEKIGPTPSHWRKQPGISRTLEEEIYMILCSTLLGETIAWSTQQAGYLVHEVVPIKKYEKEQLGFSSQEDLEWHTEDAFHSYRADYLGLMCFRNPTATPTTFGSVSNLDLSDPLYDILFEAHHTIKPDESHLEKNRALEVAQQLGEASNDAVSYDDINQMNEAPEKVAVLLGDRHEPYLRLDPYFMNPSDNPRAEQAFQALKDQIDEKMEAVVLQQGEILFLDNFRVVHGRPPFVAKYDGRDRWLKRINITRDLRKSRDARTKASCRKIHQIGISHKQLAGAGA